MVINDCAFGQLGHEGTLDRALFAMPPLLFAASPIQLHRLQIGGIGALAPEQRQLANSASRMLAGTMANLMSLPSWDSFRERRKSSKTNVSKGFRSKIADATPPPVRAGEYERAGKAADFIFSSDRSPGRNRACSGSGLARSGRICRCAKIHMRKFALPQSTAMPCGNSSSEKWEQSPWPDAGRVHLYKAIRERGGLSIRVFRPPGRKGHDPHQRRAASNGIRAGGWW